MVGQCSQQGRARKLLPADKEGKRRFAAGDCQLLCSGHYKVLKSTGDPDVIDHQRAPSAPSERCALVNPPEKTESNDWGCTLFKVPGSKFCSIHP